MANWNLPTITSGYLDFVTEMNDKFVDAGTIGYGAPTNLPEHAIRFNRSINIFEEWISGAWVAKVLAIAGGGTGGSTPAEARTALGLGSMATQNSNNVNITGGSITGVNIDAAAITTGVVALARGGTGASLALGGPGTVLLSNGTQVLFDTGINISQLNASNISTGTISDARLSVNVPLKNVDNIFTGQNQFQGYVTFTGVSSGLNSTTIITPSPLLNFYDTAMPANQRYARIAMASRNFYFQAMDDNYSGGFTYMSMSQGSMTLGSAGEGQLYAVGTNITGLNAANIATGIVPTARLGSGTANAATFLRGDNTWQAIAGGIPSGLIAIFDTSCPAGWSRVAALDNRVPLGSSGYGSAGGADTHTHSFDIQADANGGHSHGFSGSGSASGTTSDATNNAFPTTQRDGTGTQMEHVDTRHTHTFNAGVSISGNTDAVGNHDHRVRGNTDVKSNMPPYLTVVYCRKD